MVICYNRKGLVGDDYREKYYANVIATHVIFSLTLYLISHTTIRFLLAFSFSTLLFLILI